MHVIAPMPPYEDPTITKLVALMARCGLTYSEVAAASGASPSTIRICVLTRSMPSRVNACDKLRDFVRANADARTREEVRFS
jgi:hypothetical protein